MVNVLDFGQDPMAVAAAGFGQGLGNRIQENNYSQMMNKILQNEGSEDDIMKKILSSPLPQKTKELALESMLNSQRNNLAMAQAQAKAQQDPSKLNKITESYLTKAQEDSETARSSLDLIGRMNELNEKDSTGFKASIWEGLSSIPGLGALRSADSAEFDSGSSLLIERFKTSIGGRITQGEFQEFRKKLPSVRYSKEANKQLLDLVKRDSELAVKRQSIIDGIESEIGYVPNNVRSMVNQILDEEERQFVQELRNFNNANFSEGDGSAGSFSAQGSKQTQEGKVRVKDKFTGRAYFYPSDKVDALMKEHSNYEVAND